MTPLAKPLQVFHRLLPAITLGDDVVGVGRGKSSALAADRIAGEDHFPEPSPSAVVAALTGADAIVRTSDRQRTVLLAVPLGGGCSAAGSGTELGRSYGHSLSLQNFR